MTNFVRPVSLPPQGASDMAAGANAVGAAIAAALAGVACGVPFRGLQLHLLE